MFCLKIAGWVANSVDPDEMLHLHNLLRHVCPNTDVKYGTESTGAKEKVLIVYVNA